MKNEDRRTYKCFLILANIVFFSKAEYFAKLFELYDKPDNIRKIHTTSVPLLGGISPIFNNISKFIHISCFRDNQFRNFFSIFYFNI